MSGDLISSIQALEARIEKPLLVYVLIFQWSCMLLCVVQMFYFHISGHTIIPLLLALFSLRLCWSFNCEFFQCFTA